MRKTEKDWVFWLALVLVVIGLLFAGNSKSKSADAGTKVGSSFGDTTFAVPVQLGRDNYGLAMYDVDTRTIWLYELSNRGPGQPRLRLLAARNYAYDSLLTDYNTTPHPKEIKQILESLGRSQSGNSPEQELEEQAQPEGISYR
jgi:hypothetical protein